MEGRRRRTVQRKIVAQHATDVLQSLSSRIQQQDAARFAVAELGDAGDDLHLRLSNSQTSCEMEESVLNSHCVSSRRFMRFSYGSFLGKNETKRDVDTYIIVRLSQRMP